MKALLGFALALALLAVSGCKAPQTQSSPESSLASMDLQAFEEVPAEALLHTDRDHLVLYYVDKDSGRAVRYDASDDDLRLDRDDHRGQFPCILSNVFHRLFPATCWSQSGKYTSKAMDIAYKSTFDERILMVEVDTSKLLDVGINYYLREIYQPYVDYDFGPAFLGLQKLGSDNFVAACGSLQDEVGTGTSDVGLFETSDRPMMRVLLGYAHHETDWDLNYLGRILLKRGNRDYHCDGIVTVGANRLVVLSGKTLVIIDRKRKQMATLDLPMAPLNAILYRLVTAL